MFVRLSAALAALCLLSAPVFAKPTDPQIAYIAYTAGLLDIEAAQTASPRGDQRSSFRPLLNKLQKQLAEYSSHCQTQHGYAHAKQK